MAIKNILVPSNKCLHLILGKESKHKNVKKSFLSDAMAEMEYGPVSSNKRGSLKTITLPSHRLHPHYYHHQQQHYHHHRHNKGIGNMESHQKASSDSFEHSKITVKLYRPAKLALFHKPHRNHHQAADRLSKIHPEVSNAVLPIVRTIPNKDSQTLSSQAARKTFAVAKKMFLKVLEGVKNRLKHNNLTMLPHSRLEDLADANSSDHSVFLPSHEKQAITFHNQEKNSLVEDNKRLDQSDQNPDILSKEPLDESEINNFGDQKEKSVSVQKPDSYRTEKDFQPENKIRGLNYQPLAIKEGDQAVKQGQQINSKIPRVTPSLLASIKNNEKKFLKIPTYDVDINTTLKHFDLVIDATPSEYKKENPDQIVSPATLLPSEQVAKSTAEKQQQKQVASNLESASAHDMNTSGKVATNKQENDPGLLSNKPEMSKFNVVNSSNNKTVEALKLVAQLKDNFKLNSGIRNQNGTTVSHNKNESVGRLLLHSLLADHTQVLGKFDTLLKVLSNRRHENKTIGNVAKEMDLLISAISSLQKQNNHSEAQTKPRISKPVQETGYLIKTNNSMFRVGQVTVPPLEHNATGVKTSKTNQNSQQGTLSQQNLNTQSEKTSTEESTAAITPELQKPLQKLVKSLQQVTSGLNNKQEKAGVTTIQVQGKSNTTGNKAAQSASEVLTGLISLINKTADQKGLLTTLNNEPASQTGQSRVRNNNEPTKLAGQLVISQNPNSDHPNNVTQTKRPNLDVSKSANMETSSIGNGTASVNGGGKFGEAHVQTQIARNVSDKNIEPQSNKNRLLALLHNNTIINLLDNALTSPAQLSNSSSSIVKGFATRNGLKGTAKMIKNFHVSKQLAASRKAFETAKKLIQATLAREELYKAEKVFQEKLKEMLKKTDSTPGLKKINEQSSRSDTEDAHVSSQSDSLSTSPNMAVPSTPTATDAQAPNQHDSTQDKQMQETANKAAHLEEKIAEQQEKMYQELANDDGGDDNEMQEGPGTGSIRNEEEEEPVTSRDKHENYGDFQDEEEQKEFYANHPTASYSESNIDTNYPSRGYLRDRVGLPSKEDEYADNDGDADDQDPDDSEPHPFSLRDEVSVPAKHSWKDSNEHTDGKEVQQRRKLSAGENLAKTQGSDSDHDNDNDNDESEKNSDDEAIVQPEEYPRSNDVSFSDTEDLGAVEDDGDSKTRKELTTQAVVKNVAKRKSRSKSGPSVRESETEVHVKGMDPATASHAQNKELNPDTRAHIDLPYTESEPKVSDEDSFVM